MSKSKTVEKKPEKKGNGVSKKENLTIQEEMSEDLRLNVLKTYKLYIGGKFPRTESGRFYSLKDNNGKRLANMCQGSRKDFRNSVVAARKAFGGWAGRSAFNKSQIIYRIAEMLEGRKHQFIEELQELGKSKEEAKEEVYAAIDLLIYYAGWADKYQQVFSAVNPVSSSHFNFSMLEPMGVVSVFAPENSGLLGLVSAIIPIITGGNTCVVLASNSQATCAITFAEVLNSSDVPGGVVNLLTGFRKELMGHFSSHKDVNAMIYYGDDKEEITTIQNNATDTIKRVILRKEEDRSENPYTILDNQEVKTTWHPVAKWDGGNAKY